MFKPEDLPKSIANGAYTLTDVVGRGAMAAVFRASVDLEKFDFANLVACHEAVEGANEEERTQHRQRRYEQLKQRPREELMLTVERLQLPYPASGVAAVKVMLPSQTNQEGIAQRFEAEWRQLQALNHPNLIQVYGGGVDGTIRWYAMNLVENIIEVEECKALDDATTLDIINQAAAGLGALHERGIIHRDMKPANLLIARNEAGRMHTYVMDLGIAKNPGAEGLTMSHDMMGTPYYMSPEQAQAAKRVDARADVYSLGATLYTLATGSRPYEGKAMYEVVGQIIRGEAPAPPLSVKPDLNGYVARLIEAMMEADVNARMPTMPAVSEAINAILGGDKAACDRLLKPRRRGKARGGTEERKSSGFLTRMFGFGRDKRK